ncbi:GNAT family N-acetyltransferase [Acidaminobacter sp. JC074]|uniref:GNAT family N-acetyltransferase n=1 Tax=Acidaminobacter sp. JC074 TaxID=2530199 RepID=UPI001F0E2F45|nr:GNAT family N-acetyltransferase [Acidaminobacter sp. JC074]MCH4885958.1 GNAT family N-acetyltransferase [Acidaminobacter sp. JC074]
MVKAISYQDTYEIRHKVMWPDRDLDYIKLDCDPEGDHYGYFLDDHLVSVISVFKTSHGYQFRKFATLHDYQGKGIGSELLKYVKDKYQNLWCNARIEKTDFYKRFGLRETDETFTKGGKEYVIMRTQDI